MNIHEYQARELFAKYGVATQPGSVANTPEEAEQIATGLKVPKVVVKAQIHAGGRGKGTFKSGFKGGVHLASSPAEAKDFAGKMLGETLVTHQTGEEGKVVSKVFVVRPWRSAASFTLPSSRTARPAATPSSPAPRAV